MEKLRSEDFQQLESYRGDEPSDDLPDTPEIHDHAEQSLVTENSAAPQSASVDNELREERRSGNRREVSVDRALSVPGEGDLTSDWLPRRWPYLSVAMLAAAAVAIISQWQMPPAPADTLIFFAIVLTFCLKVQGFLPSRMNMLAKLFIAAVLVAAPLFLFGLGFTKWVQIGGLDWKLAAVGIVCVIAVASCYLRNSIALMVLGQLALLVMPVMAMGGWVGIVGLGATALIAAFIGLEQSLERKAQLLRKSAAERMQNRARDILTDYENTGQGWFWETDRRSLLTYISPTIAKIVGKTADELIGKPMVGLFDLEDMDKDNERTLLFHLNTRSSFKELPTRASTADQERWWSVSGRPIFDSFNNFVGFRGSGTDLTERKKSEEKVTRLANYDSLTGLANRFQMSQALEKILSSPQIANRECSIFLLDLDRFKQVNDTMGHPVGDVLLQQVAKRLERAVGAVGQVGRLGGDEFKVVILGRVGNKRLAELAQEILHSVSQPYTIEGQRIVINVSIGIARAPDDAKTSEDLIRNADLALYAAKDGGRGRYHFYAEDLHADAEARAQLEEDLRDAMTNGQMQLFYQPVVSTATEQITGFEALLRWHHPIKGWIPPQSFVAAAEDTGLIMQLGEWALRTACHDLAQWPEDVRVAVNVSPLQFANPQLPSVITSALANAGVAPERLELEITESVFLSDDEGTDAMFAALKRIGVRLALDDFGTGYSSLGYLKKAPFDKIKIDQSFVRGATEQGSRNGAIIASITSLAQALGMETTAEGVETHDELDLIRMLGCSHVQGYIYERPLDLNAANERLEIGLAATARGPKSTRAPRQTMLRKVVLDHSGNKYNGTVRNISIGGALIEGLWNVPEGTEFKVQLSQGFTVSCAARWCLEDRMGVEFAEPLLKDEEGRFIAINGSPPKPIVRPLGKKAS